MYHLYAHRGRWIEEATACYASEAMRLFNTCDAQSAYLVSDEGVIYTSRNLDKVFRDR